MRRLVISIIGGCVLLLFTVTCCPDNNVIVEYPPEGTLRYWDEHDTIVFYSPELDVYEKYPVCIRDYVGSVYETHDRCNTHIQGYAAQYFMNKDSCESIDDFMIRITADGIITVSRVFSTGEADDGRINTDYLNNTSLEISGHEYEEAYLIPFDSPFDSLSAVYVTLEHGIIQYRFDSTTFNLINDEI